MSDDKPHSVEVTSHTGIVRYYVNGEMVEEEVEYTSTKTYRADGSFDNTIKLPRLKASGKTKKE